MASQDVLRKLEEEAAQQAKALELSQLFYDVEETANLLHISRAKLYRYLNDTELQIETISFENDRKTYVLAEDVRRLYVILHTPYLQSSKNKPRPVHRPHSAGEAAIMRHMVQSH